MSDDVISREYKLRVYSSWLNKDYGLDLHKFPEEIPRPNRIRASENSILFLVEYLMGLHMIDCLHEKDREIFVRAVKAIEAYDKNRNRISGLYDRGGGESLWENKDSIRTISHDNITAIASMSYLLGMSFHREIIDHGKRNFWRFDNVYPESPRWSRILHPRDIIYLMGLSDYFWHRVLSCLLWPLLLFTQILSCLKKHKIRPKFHHALGSFFRGDGWPVRRKIIHTDGKILMILRFYPLVDDAGWLTRKVLLLCGYILKGKFGHNYPANMFNFYFKDENHPVRAVWRWVNPRRWNGSA